MTTSLLPFKKKEEEIFVVSPSVFIVKSFPYLGESFKRKVSRYQSGISCVIRSHKLMENRQNNDQKKTDKTMTKSKQTKQ
jgi:hypothetical protein